MRVYGLSVLLLAAIPMSGWADDYAGIYAAASEAYAEGRVEEAAKGYQTLLDLGCRQAEVWYNLGNSHYRMGQQAKAIHAFECARLLDPSDPDIRANLDTVVRESGAASSPRPAWHLLVLRVPEAMWLAVAIGGWWAFFLLAMFAAWSAGPTPLVRKWATAGCTVALAGGAGWGARQHAQQQLQVVMMRPDVPARFQPLSDGKPRFTLAPGSIAWLQERRNGWWALRTGEKVGWVPAEACKLIEP